MTQKTNLRRNLTLFGGFLLTLYSLVLHWCLKFFELSNSTFHQSGPIMSSSHSSQSLPAGTDWVSQYLKLGGGLLYHPALDGYLSHSDRTPHTWMMTSLNICSTALQYMASMLSSMTIAPSNHLLPSNLLPSEPTTHRPPHCSFPHSSAGIHMSHDLGLICVYIIVERRCEMKWKARQMRF